MDKIKVYVERAVDSEFTLVKLTTPDGKVMWLEDDQVDWVLAKLEAIVYERDAMADAQEYPIDMERKEYPLDSF